MKKNPIFFSLQILVPQLAKNGNKNSILSVYRGYMPLLNGSLNIQHGNNYACYVQHHSKNHIIILDILRNLCHLTCFSHSFRSTAVTNLSLFKYLFFFTCEDRFLSYHIITVPRSPLRNTSIYNTDESL